MSRIGKIMACMFAGVLWISPAEDLAAETSAGTVVRTSGGAQSYWVEQLAEGLNLPSSPVVDSEVRRQIIGFLRRQSL